MKQGEWNRREFIVKPLVFAGAAGVLGRTESLVAQPATTPSGPLLTRMLGKTGISLPIVSMGVMNADIPGLLRRSYELGIRHFDTAASYQQGRNEEMVGQVIKELGVRDKVIISTKQAVRNHHLPTEEGKERFVRGVEASLERLQMDHVDILYSHAVDSPNHLKEEGHLQALQALKKEGKARFIGISTHNTVEVIPEAVKLNMFDVFLVTWNYTMAHDQEMLNIIKHAANSGIGIVAMKTQAGGTVRPDPKLPKQLPLFSQTALLKWVLNHEFVTTAIPGFSTYQHLEQDFPVARDLAYTDEEKQFLADKAFAASAEFCHQCGQCREDCPKRVDIPVLMRSHMYAVQYGNRALARQTLAELPIGKGIEACGSCDTCAASCRNSVRIARKIDDLKALAFC
ncbi:MAG TPA: aldo/keto reductase [Candidatus Sulfotelmatobacter sp.]|nr:aldo/keto reductase [Candidatus Sulfotelmatobacter sp.]